MNSPKAICHLLLAATTLILGALLIMRTGEASQRLDQIRQHLSPESKQKLLAELHIVTQEENTRPYSDAFNSLKPARNPLDLYSAFTNQLKKETPDVDYDTLSTWQIQSLSLATMRDVIKESETVSYQTHALSQINIQETQDYLHSIDPLSALANDGYWSIKRNFLPPNMPWQQLFRYSDNSLRAAIAEIFYMITNSLQANTEDQSLSLSRFWGDDLLSQLFAQTSKTFWKVARPLIEFLQLIPAIRLFLIAITTAGVLAIVSMVASEALLLSNRNR